MVLTVPQAAWTSGPSTITIQSACTSGPFDILLCGPMAAFIFHFSTRGIVINQVFLFTLSCYMMQNGLEIPSFHHCFSQIYQFRSFGCDL